MVASEMNFKNKIQVMTSKEIRDVIAHCETAIAEGKAEIQDYEAFVLCQQELAQRTWS